MCAKKSSLKSLRAKADNPKNNFYKKKIEDYIGLRSGKLEIIRYSHTTPSYHRYFVCKCDCGNEVIVRSSCIIKGYTKSCGCLSVQNSRVRNLIHGYFGTRLYNIWSGLRRRCYDKNVQSYKDYGGRGITFCDDWNDFISFKNWALSHGYKHNLTLDRIDFNGNYEPTNCRWISMKEQQRNKRSNRVIDFNGSSHCLSEWAEIININYSTLCTRLNVLHWSVKKAFTEPVGYRK